MGRKAGYTTITLDLPIEWLEWLDNYCEVNYISTRTALIRELIKELMVKEEN